MTTKVSTIRKCKNIRDRIYDREQLPGPIFNKEVSSLVTSDSILVDIGCGRDAPFLHSFSSCVKKAYGIDLEVSETIVDGNIEIVNGNAEAIPLPDNSVDIITFINVVEHLRNPEKVFTECKRILKPGGSIGLTTPSKYHPPILIGRLFPHRIRQWANRIMTGTKNIDTFPAYYKANSSGVLRKLASSVGIDIVSIRFLSNHPQFFMFSTLLYRIAVVFERFLLRRNVFRGLRQQVFCQIKKR